MTQLFDAFEEESDAIDIPMKFGILTNGNETINKKELVSKFTEMLKERLVDSAGFSEIDEEVGCLVGDDDSDMFRFKGALDVIGHITNIFTRREWC